MIVVDCSALVDALAVADGTDALRERLAAEQLHAPELLDYEVLSVVRKLTLAGRLSPGRAVDLLGDFEDLAIERWPPVDVLARRAFELRDALPGYDAAYVALAEVLGGPLVTRDARLARAGAHRAEVALY